MARSFNGAASVIEAEAAMVDRLAAGVLGFNGAASVIEAEGVDVRVSAAPRQASTGPPR